MKIDILTLFPEMLEAALKTSIIGRAEANGLISINCVQIRDFAFNKHRQVDDYPYGGGQGMVMQAEPIFKAYESVTEGLSYKPKTIYYIIHITKNENRKKFFIYNYKERK